MAARGFQMPPGGETTAEQLERARASAPARQGEFGLIDADHAARYGYAPGSSQVTSAAQGADMTWEAQVRKHGVAYMRALHGYDDPSRAAQPHPSSCRAEAERALDVPAEGVDVDLQGRLALEAADRTRGDRRVIDVFSAWSACMAERGYRYREPAEPAQARWSRPTPTPAELATARADIACKQRTRLLQVWLEVEQAHQDELVARHATALAELRDYYERRVRRAREVLGR